MKIYRKSPDAGAIALCIFFSGICMKSKYCYRGGPEICKVNFILPQMDTVLSKSLLARHWKSEQTSHKAGFF